MHAWLNRRTLGWVAVIGLLGFAALHLLVRGPVDHKGTLNLMDFASPWTSARLWLSGSNPYVSESLYDAWRGAGGFETAHDWWLAMLPPGGFALLSPLAMVPPGVGSAIFVLICLASVVAVLWSVIQLAGLQWGSLLTWLFISGAVASAPIQTLLAVGQVSLPAIALIFLAYVAAQRRFDVVGGLLLGLAATLKPQLAAPFFLWFLFFARWRVFFPALAVAALMNLVGIIPMELRDIPWWSEWYKNMVISTTPGAPNDPTATGPWRHQIIDLRVWLFTIFDGKEFVIAKALIVCALLAAAYVMILCRLRDDDDQGRLLALATLSALTLLPVYHRLYDAALLLPAFAWALVALRTRPLRGVAIATLISLSAFLVPFDFLKLITERTDVLDGFTNTWLWRVVIFPHHALATLLTCLCLLVAFWQTTRQYEVATEEEGEEERSFARLAPSRS